MIAEENQGGVYASGHPLGIFTGIHSPSMLCWLISRARARWMRDFVLGDFAALGFDPVTPLEKLTPSLMPVSPVAIPIAMW